MAVFMVSIVKKGISVLGYRLYDTVSGKTKDVPTASLTTALRKGTVKVDNLGYRDGEIVGTMGGLSRYAISQRDPKHAAVEKGRDSIVITRRVMSLSGVESFHVLTSTGKTKVLSVQDTVKVGKQLGISNGEIVIENGVETVKGIGRDFEFMDLKKEMDDINNKAVEQEFNKALKNMAKQEGIEVDLQDEDTGAKSSDIQKRIKEAEANKESIDSAVMGIADLSKVSESSKGNTRLIRPTGFPVVTVTNPAQEALSEVDTESGMTLEEKMVRANIAVNKINPFIYGIISALADCPVDDSTITDTLAVSLRTLYWNAGFVKKTNIDTLVFILMHEAGHIFTKTHIRFEKKDGQLSNIVSDIFINEMLCKEYDVRPGSTVYPLDKKVLTVGIAPGEGGLYNEKLNSDNEIQEDVYREFETLLDGCKQREKKDPAYAEMVKMLGYYELEWRDKKYQYKLGGGGSGGDGSTGGSGNDVVTESQDEGMSEDMKNMLSDSMIKKAMDYSKRVGGEKGTAMERIAAKVTAPKINWVPLVKRKLIEASQTINTYARPDRRFLHEDRILPGPKPAEKNKLKGVKACIDVSGSITDEELGKALAQLKQLLTLYKAEAELIYWDTEVRVAEPFNSVEEMFKIKPKGNGGTDVECVFEYLMDKKRCKVPPSIILIFTDGYFSTPSAKYVKLGRETVWIVTDRQNFHPPYGKCADMRL